MNTDPDNARDIKVADEVMARADRSQWRVTIAEFCGWRRSPWDHDVWLSPGATWSEEKGVAPDSMGDGELPDYLNDLNAMHEAERLLNKEAQCSYLDFLSSIVSPTNEMKWHAMKILHATATQRAEALLRVIGKLQ